MKVCTRCKIEKPLTEFIVDKHSNSGYTSWCSNCKNIYSKEYRKEHQKERNKYNKEYDFKNRERKSIYRKEYTLKNREKILLLQYKRVDKKKGLECDLTVEWMKENITSKSCSYCSDIYNLGCDRIDNDKGHTMDNCIPCCTECNTARMDNFSVEEMIEEIGPAIKRVKQSRANKLYDLDIDK